MIDWLLFWTVFGRWAACMTVALCVIWLIDQNVEADEEELKRIRRQWDRMYMETFAPMGSRPREYEEGGDDEAE